jgi:hypothetical protein
MQIGRSASDAEHLLENRCELREESTRQLDVICELSPFPTGMCARIWKAIMKLKDLIIGRLF